MSSSRGLRRTRSRGKPTCEDRRTESERDRDGEAREDRAGHRDGSDPEQRDLDQRASSRASPGDREHGRSGVDGGRSIERRESEEVYGGHCSEASRKCRAHPHARKGAFALPVRASPVNEEIAPLRTIYGNADRAPPRAPRSQGLGRKGVAWAARGTDPARAVHQPRRGSHLGFVHHQDGGNRPEDR